MFRLHRFCLIFFCILFNAFSTATAASDSWRTVQLSSRPISIAASGNVLWVSGADEMIAKSSDAGQSWQIQHQKNDGAVLLDIGFANDRIGYASGTHGTLLLTADGGSTWKSIAAGTETIYKAAFADERHGLIQTASSLEFTTDGGTSWTDIEILKSDKALEKFKYVLNIAALDSGHMATLLKEGPAQYFPGQIVVTEDAGKTWKIVTVPSVNILALVTHGGEYWMLGSEVIEKEKKGGGHAVPLALHSADGENWEHSTRPGAEVAACNGGGCLLRDGAGINPFGPAPLYWTFPAQKVITPKWAAVSTAVCSISSTLECAATTASDALPARADEGSIGPILTPPALGAPRSSGLACISCPYEHIVVSDKVSGMSEIDLEVLVATNGTVSEVKIVKAPTPELGSLFADAVQAWIFEPYTKDGHRVQVRAPVKLSVQVINSR